MQKLFDLSKEQSLHKNKFSVGAKIKDYIVFTKFRLASLVIISALSGYLFAGGNDWMEVFYLMIGGLLVTAASNGSNQIWERDVDRLMNRTKRRPLVEGTMNVTEGVIIVVVCLLVGEFMLYQLNFHSALLGLIAFVSYVFIYTPMKPISPWAVFVGAFPGAIPPMLGAIAVTGEYGLMPGALFFVQFVWQFPHFWAIAWVADEDYRAGGFDLLPSKKGKGKETAFQIALYSFLLIAFSLFPWVIEITSNFTLVGATILSTVFFLYAYRLLVTCDDKDAKKLMFASFIYLPLIQYLYVFDKLVIL